MFSMTRCLLLALSACVLIAACGDGAPEPDAAATSSSKKTAPKAADPGANMVAAVSAGKTATAVGVHFSLGAAPTVNTGLPVDIAIIPHEAFTSLSGHFESQEGLTLMSGDKLAIVANVGAEKALKHQLALMPVREGVFIVTASIETEGAEGTVTRVFSIPVIVEANAPAVANPPAEAPAKPAETPAAN
jgi:hypothetical protein